MKKINELHKYIIGMLLGVLLVGSISVYAVTAVIEGSEVSYNNQTSKGSYTNVQGSIDELYQRYKDLTGETSTKYTESILNGADPVLGTGMIPVTIDGDGKVKYANVNTPWYKYAEKRWANAVILVKTPSKSYKTGDTILEKDIESYFVWIPRYSYKIWDLGNYKESYSFSQLNDAVSDNTNEVTIRRLIGNARLIEIKFGKNENSTNQTLGNYYTHPAFTNFGVSGLWIGKFEITGSINAITVKPGTKSLGNQTIGDFWRALYGYNRVLDSHMMKNTEWGAVAYLSHSIYGKGAEVNINNNSEHKTGYSAAANTDQSSTPGDIGSEATVTQPYNTPTGYLASTTGNITGIYDMSGGSYEYVAAYINGHGQDNNSGLSTAELNNNTKYFDKYLENSTYTTYNNRILGDATGEMGPFYEYYDKEAKRFHGSWYADCANFLSLNGEANHGAWMHRGGTNRHGSLAGLFHFSVYTGDPLDEMSSRLVLAPK